MKTVCCICGKTMKENSKIHVDSGDCIDTIAKNSNRISHGICEKCLPGYMKEQKEWLGKNE